MKLNLSPALTRTLGRQKLLLKKSAPHIFFAAGVGSVIAGTIMACRATTKAGPIVDEFHHDLKAVEELKERNIQDNKFDEKEYGKDMAYVYLKGTLRLARLYGPSAAVSIAGITMLSGSHIMMVRRNAALSATLAMASKAFNDYRNRVRNEIGEEKEKQLYIGEFREEVIELESGETKEVVTLADPNTMSMHSRIFEATNEFWERDAEMNRNFIQCQQNFANALLQARGHLFLNEAYDMLGLPRSRAGTIVGWVLRGPNSDNYVDFGMYHPKNFRFMNGVDQSIILDFNVDGEIDTLIEWNRLR